VQKFFEVLKFFRGIFRIPWWGIWQVIVVFMYGAWKHRNDLWCDMNYGWSHYENKVDRHRIERWRGTVIDPEFDRPHLAHACCDLVMAMNKDKHGKMHPNAPRCLENRRFEISVLLKCE